MRSIQEIKFILSQAFNMNMFYDADNSYSFDLDDINAMIYHIGCYKNLNDLTDSEIEMFCDYAHEIRKGCKNESI